MPRRALRWVQAGRFADLTAVKGARQGVHETVPAAIKTGERAELEAVPEDRDTDVPGCWRIEFCRCSIAAPLRLPSSHGRFFPSAIASDLNVVIRQHAFALVGLERVYAQAHCVGELGHRQVVDRTHVGSVPLYRCGKYTHKGLLNTPVRVYASCMAQTFPDDTRVHYGRFGYGTLNSISDDGWANVDWDVQPTGIPSGFSASLLPPVDTARLVFVTDGKEET